MSDDTAKRRAAALAAGLIDGVKLKVKAEYPEGLVAVETASGERRFLSTAFVDLLLLRKRGRLA